jgi:exodeoxyribonuclease V beta subunit
MSSISKFNAITAPLDGSNLVEASAGTGKTYSIGILVLRLLLEKELQVKEILMVTFTNAAVAELEQRIRLFIRKAYKASLNEEIDDATILELVNNSINSKGQKETQQILKDAVLFLDETNVLTIHGFCQQTLTEFAFETDQMFGIELLLDASGILEEKINQFWRQYVTTIPAELLGYLIEEKFSRAGISDLLKGHLSGKKYFAYQEGKQYSICEEDHLNTLEVLKKIKLKEKKLEDILIKSIEKNKEGIIKKACSNQHAKAFIPLLERSPQLFLHAFFNKRKQEKVPAYLSKLFREIMDQCDDCDSVKKEIEAIVGATITQLNCIAIHTIVPAIRNIMTANNQLSFDDLIGHLYKAIATKDNPVLIQALRNKYKAVFIDEFQDTDKMQYEIFKRAFGAETILFYIGDPKQSIYAFRTADIFTYFNAYADVQRRYEMDENYRSSKSLIDAMNHFFVPEENFDTFYFSGEENKINYIDVASPKNNTKGVLIKDKEEVAPISISEHAKKEDIYNAVAAQVIDLLENKYVIDSNGKETKLNPSDIGILVKQNKQGRAIKQALSKYGIPAVIISDAKLFKSSEAKYVLYLLMAMADPDQKNINKALLSPFTGFETNEILQIDSEKSIRLFNNYKSRWEQEGIYPALMDFVNDFSVKSILLETGVENGERALTNFYQLMELLHKTQSEKKFSALELINWYSRGIQGMKMEGDEYLQRIESDEEAIKITTIHKSKGLEYKIVLAPFLDFTIYGKNNFIQFRDPDSREYVTIEKNKISDEQLLLANKQQEQEFRRLLYVAITRAVYKVFIFRNLNWQFKSSTLFTFISHLNTENSGLIELIKSPQLPEKYSFNKRNQSKTNKEKHQVNFKLLHENWKRLSYTFLSAHNERSLKDKTVSSLDKYDQFMFHQLKAGAQTGIMLHDIFEKIHFSDESKWKSTLEDISKKYSAKKKEELFPLLEEMLHQVLNHRIRIKDVAFKLNEVSFDKRIHEFEFDFPVPAFDPQTLNSLSDENIKINVEHREELEGLMNGKIDLFFECRQKYFVLDWKSNFLGASLDAYSREKLKDAMNENNYHLQYLIYTVAVKKYLESRMPDFDYETHFGGVIYVFLRGVRSKSDTGFFVCKPPLKTIKKLEKIVGNKVFATLFS